MKKFSNILAALALTAFAGIASAVPISGNLVFNGTVTHDSTSVDTADVFTFADPVGVLADGDFSPISGGTVDFNPLDTSLPFSAVSPLWTTTLNNVTYSFDLNLITFDSRYDLPTLSGSRIINGTGLLTITGLGSTSGIFKFTTQDIAVGGTFTFSASNAPEPAITLLLATGLVGFGFARRARKSA